MALDVLVDQHVYRNSVGAAAGVVGGATVAITNKATGGTIGTAAATVDIAYFFTVNQTTASQTLTVPTPTDATAGKEIIVDNIGSQSFTMAGATVAANAPIRLLWDGVAWRKFV